MEATRVDSLVVVAEERVVQRVAETVAGEAEETVEAGRAEVAEVVATGAATAETTEEAGKEAASAAVWAVEEV